MTNFISSQILFYLALFIVFIVPGYFLVLATRLYKEFSILELFVLIFTSSIAIINFLIILLGRSPLHINGFSVIGTIMVFCATCYYIYHKECKKNHEKTCLIPAVKDDRIAKRSMIIVLVIMTLTIFINLLHFKDSIYPTTTDLGHHMYWAKVITTTGQLPNYQKADIGNNLTIQAPQPIADFIIGEHLFFAAIQLISQADFVSAFPILVLFVIHIVTLLAIFVLTRTFFKNSSHKDAIAITALFLIGPLYAIASPQAKFISGGVIGNDVGNLFIPVAVLLFITALSKKKTHILAYAMFICLGMAYVHHLSTFVFIFLAFFTVLAYGVLNYKTLSKDLKLWLKLFTAPSVLLVLLMGAVFIFLLYTPTYLNTHAINTAVGAPSKASRAGLTLTQLKSTAGEARFAFALVGIIFLFFAGSLGKYRQAFLIGWVWALAMMSLRPDWLLVDIPSNRIASYIVFPIAIIASYMFVCLFTAMRTENKNKNYLSPVFLLFTFFILIIFVTINGLYDNAIAINSGKSSANNAQQTYIASQYLAAHSLPADMILKDHNYLAGDTWIKLFFMQDYNYPLSRGYFKRYQDDTKSREQCTNLMISSPNSDEAKQCYNGTHTDFIMINPQMDSAQFHRDTQFWQVYSSDDVGIFYKAK